MDPKARRERSKGADERDRSVGVDASEGVRFFQVGLLVG